MIEDRLDEKTARRIASGRLATARKDAEEAMRQWVARTPRSKNSKTRSLQFVDCMQRAYGRLVLYNYTEGRTTCIFLAQPIGSGSVAIDMLLRNSRSNSFLWKALLNLTPHSTARLMERRRSAKVEELISQEFDAKTIICLMKIVDATHSIRASGGTFETDLPTLNGHFVVEPDESDVALLAAKTWIDKPRG